LVDLAGIGQHPVQARLKDCDQPHIFPDEPLQHFLHVSHQQVQV
jgi:hypothetical protein